MTYRASIGGLAVAALFLGLAWPAAAKGGEAKEPPAIKAPSSRIVMLHVFAKAKDDASVRRLARLLKADGFKILFVELAAESESPKVAVEGSRARFRRVFAVRFGVRVVPMSGRAAFKEELTVSAPTVPKRYVGLVAAVDIPDPQIY